MIDGQNISMPLTAEAYERLLTERMNSLAQSLNKFIDSTTVAVLDHVDGTAHEDAVRLGLGTLMDAMIAQHLTQSRTLTVLEEMISTLADISRTLSSMKDDTEAIETRGRKR